MKYGSSCTFCHGSGMVDVKWDEFGDGLKALECGECDGLGMILTDEGAELFFFLSKLKKAKRI